MAVINLQVNKSGSDASQDATTKAVTITEKITNFNETEKGYWACRFEAVEIPVGATINELIFEIWLTKAVAKDVFGSAIYQENSCAVFAGTSNELLERAHLKSVTGGFEGAIGFNQFKSTPATEGSFARRVQELVKNELPGGVVWTSGNAIGFLLTATNAKATKIVNYDESPEKAPKLQITYTPPAAGAASQPPMMV